MTREERVSYWRGVIDRYRDSGLSGAAFCREHDISLGRFYQWRRRLAQGDEGSFFELIPCSASPGGRSIQIHLTNGITIEVGRGFDPVTLRGVLETVVGIRQCSQ